MTCSRCGNHLEEGSTFCSSCGARVEDVTTEVSSPKPAKCWDVFAKVGYGLGLGGFIGSFFIIGLAVTVPGIVFSILGKRSIDFNDKAKKGLVFSILGAIIGSILYFVYIFLVIFLMEDY